MTQEKLNSRFRLRDKEKSSTSIDIFTLREEIISLHVIARAIENHEQYLTIAKKIRDCADELSSTSKVRGD